MLLVNIIIAMNSKLSISIELSNEKLVGKATLLPRNKYKFCILIDPNDF